MSTTQSSTTQSSNAHFSPALFDFLRDLAENNDRDWFAANKERYEDDVLDPCLRFISDVGPGLAEISDHVQALPKKVGGSMFRIYRDVRFSKDKRPYKTHVGLHFRHKQAKDAHAPGFYLHLDPDEVFVGAGIWQPPSKVLQQIRQAIVEDPDGWRQARDDAGMAGDFELTGDSLKRPPRGFDGEHPLIDDIKRKDFFVLGNLDPDDVLEPDFLPRFVALCRTTRPLLAWICGALEVPF